MSFFGLTALAGLDAGGPFKANTRSILNIRSKEDWIDLHNLYQLYDIDQNGTIDVKQLKDMLSTWSNREAPDDDVEALQKRLDQSKNGLSWDELVEGVLAAGEENARLVKPVTEYLSASMLRTDVTKHHRRKTGPQQQFKQPMLTSQVIGWSEGMMPPLGETRHHHRNAVLSAYAVAMDHVKLGKTSAL